MKALRTVYREGYRYKKAGVIVDDIVDQDAVQGVIFDFDDEMRRKQDTLSAVMDAVNGNGRRDRPLSRRRHGSGSDVIGVASQHLGHFADGIRSEHRSRRYSTDFSELMEVH